MCCFSLVFGLGSKLQNPFMAFFQYEHAGDAFTVYLSFMAVIKSVIFTVGNYTFLLSLSAS